MWRTSWTICDVADVERLYDAPEAAATIAPRVAIVLFNLGGPDRPESIRPFLLNLFRDPAILRVPPFIRPFLARYIANRRVAPATENYAYLGGRSPLLELTQGQARALRDALPDLDAACFIAMRYWHPFAAEAVRELIAFQPDHVLLLPLYPQFSTTTTGSSLADWRENAARAGLAAPVTTLCCWPTDVAYVDALTTLTHDTLVTARASGTKIRLLFSAHGLPEIIIKRGDPYQWQIEQTAAAIAERLMSRPEWAELDWLVCYQSRATPQKWLDPSTESEIERAAADQVGVVIVPIAFVSDHTETLVELDIEYRELADRAGLAGYWRVPAPNSDPAFIRAVAGLVRVALGRGPGTCSHLGPRACPASHTGCPLALAARQTA
jgi:ferrochelatase